MQELGTDKSRMQSGVKNLSEFFLLGSEWGCFYSGASPMSDGEIREGIPAIDYLPIRQAQPITQPQFPPVMEAFGNIYS